MRSARLLMTVALALAACAMAQATPYPRKSTPAGTDLGVTSQSAVTVTVALALRNADQLQAQLQAIYTPGSPQYHRYLTPEQFASAYGPAPAAVARITRHYEAAGLSVARASTTLLRVSGSAAAVQAAFGVELHDYLVPATREAPAYQYHAALGALEVPADIAADVQGVFGLDSRPHYRPHLRHPHGALGTVPARSSGAPSTTDPPGFWTVVDFGQYYDVDPLYAQGITGSRQTLGILTLASFTQSDAYGYWSSLGLKVSPRRITEVQIDGGSGPPSDDSGSDETTLDVEQSGGIAPGAKILVYEAPNTTQGFIDLFATAIDANRADTLSVSWGEWEYLDVIPPLVTDPVTRRTTTTLRALNDLLTQAALQGQTVFDASGDAGAYDADDFFPVPSFTNVLSVDDPGAQQFMVVAGGTTLPGTQTYTDASGNVIFSVNIRSEQAWGWDYLEGLCKAIGVPDPVDCGIFDAGGGGGVSSYVPLPFYQYGVPGIAATQPGQALIDKTQKPPQLIVRLPAGFLGRNLPDISVNADPQTGYIVPYTSDKNGFEVEQLGGTSFSAPQLNGVTALYSQALGQRLGLLNVPLYDLVRSNAAYGGSHAPLRDIVRGDNWFYTGRRGYDQATGVGVPDVANLLRALQEYYE